MLVVTHVLAPVLLAGCGLPLLWLPSLPTLASRGLSEGLGPAAGDGGGGFSIGDFRLAQCDEVSPERAVALSERTASGVSR